MLTKALTKIKSAEWSADLLVGSDPWNPIIAETHIKRESPWLLAAYAVGFVFIVCLCIWITTVALFSMEHS